MASKYVALLARTKKWHGYCFVSIGNEKPKTGTEMSSMGERVMFIKKINQSNTVEIFRKLLNSIARKYDCGVHFYLEEAGRINYTGDRDCAKEIYNETLSLIGAR